MRTEPGGYAVIIPIDNLCGFLPTQAVLRTDEEITAQFVCVHNQRILLSARFSKPSQGPDQQGSPVPKCPLPIVGVGALSLLRPEPEEPNLC
jgi:hypothetical protein